MKKALVVLLALAVVASGFAQPVADVNVAEFSGNASVTWGVDLDKDNATGFKNETEAKVVVNIFDAAEQSTEGDGIWAELVVKTDALKIVNKGKEGKFDTGDDGIRIDTAKLHFNDLYVGIKADGTKVGKFHLPRALNFEKIMTVPGVGPDRAAGIVAGYDSDLFSVAVDFRSVKAVDAVASKFDAEAYNAAIIAYMLDNAVTWKDAKGKPQTGDPSLQLPLFCTEAVDGVSQYSNDYAIRAKLGLKPVDGLEANVGFSYAFESEAKGLGANVSYALPVGDFTLTPGLGYSTSLGDNEKGLLAIGLLFGFNAGNTGDDPVGLPYFDKDGLNKKGVSGVSVSTELNLSQEDMIIPLTVGLYTGDIVENLTAAFVLDSADVSKIGDNFVVAAALKYAAAVGDGTITPRAGVLVKQDTDLQATVGAEFAGFVDNTTFDAVWKSGNLKAEPDAKMGTFNVSVKIAL